MSFLHYTINIITLMFQDYETHKGKTESDDVLQSGGGPSTQTPRGHQAPAAFLIMASGLDAVSGHTWTQQHFANAISYVFS